jgi:hypothetical protein
MKKAITILILISYSYLINAQKDLREGYIVTLAGDTVWGKINFRNDINNSMKCIFNSNLNEIEEFLPFEISSYRFKDGKYYISKNVKNQDSIIKIFAEYLVNGQRDLFYFRDFSGFHYLLSYDDSTLVELPYKKEIITKDGRQYQYESNYHVDYLKSYFYDCPSIFPEIEKIKEPNLNNLVSITKEYHQLTCGDSIDCIVYNKKKFPKKFAVEPHFSILQFSGTDVHLNQYGGYLYLWLPQSNENLFFKSGLLYSNYDEEISIIKLPIQFEYLFTNKIIRPKLDVGVNVYMERQSGYTTGTILTMSVASGILVQFSKNAFLNLNIETDLFQFSYKTDFFISQSLGIGMIIFL